MRKYGPVVTVIVLIVAIVAVLIAFYHHGQAAWSEDRLMVSEAKASTGPCGDQQIIVIDKKRVAIAGRVVPPNLASQFQFEGGPKTLRVFSNHGELLMERKPQR